MSFRDPPDPRRYTTMLTILAGSLSLVPQLALQQRVAVPLAARRLAVSPQAALTTDEKIVPRDVLLGNIEPGH